MKKPVKPARENISPSDLTFGLSTCKRCLWVKYWYKVTSPMAMPLVGTLSRLQEEYFQGADMPTIDPALRAGKVTKWSEFVKSAPIVIDGAQTRWRILGKYDLLSSNEDGTVGLIDCKVSESERDSGAFYSPQLEAYAYALEKPLTGKAVEVASMGLLVWKPTHTMGNNPDNAGFGIYQKYISVPRNQTEFISVISQFIDVLEGEIPEAGPTCETCNFLTSRNALDLL